jgi:hypothetical protein
MAEVDLKDFMAPKPKASAKQVNLQSFYAPASKGIDIYEDIVKPAASATYEAVSEAAKSAWNHPLQIPGGAIEALGAGGGAMGQTALAGLGGLAGAAKGALTPGDTAAAGFDRWKAAVEGVVDKIPLEPETEVGNKLLNVLGLIPRAIHGAGEIAYEATGSPTLAAGTEGLAALLSLLRAKKAKEKGPEVGKAKGGQSTRSAPSTPPPSAAPEGAKAAMDAFDRMAAEAPEQARDLANHVDDEKLRKELNDRIDSITIGKQKQVKDIFKQAKERGPGAMAVTELDLPAIMQGRAKKGGGGGQSAPPAPSTPPQSTPPVTPERAAANFRNLLRKGWEIELDKGKAVPYTDPTVYMHMGIPVTKAHIEKAFSIGKQALGTVRGKLRENVPHYEQLERELTQGVEVTLRAVAPESLGKDAKAAAAILGKNQAIQMMKEAQFQTYMEPRRTFWNYRTQEAGQFIDGYERGQTFADPLLNKAAQGYRNWNHQIYLSDVAKGVKYEPRDSYLYHLFEDGDKVADHFDKHYGPKWRDPRFTKERGFSFYSEAIKAGFRPKYTNPEDIMIARQRASDIAHMRIDILNELEQYGLARKAVPKQSLAPDETEYRSPNGQRFWVKGDARQVLHNAYDTRSLWDLKGPVGTAFRGSMGLKNSIVPIMLNLSLYHPAHVLWGMYNGAAMARIAKELLAGNKSLKRGFVDMLKAHTFWDFPEDWRVGGKLMAAYKGKVTLEKLSEADRKSLQYMNEGGLVPVLQSHFRMQSIERMREALQQGHVVKASFHAPFALVQSLQRPVMEVMVPRLKIASYLRDVQTALRIDPTLEKDPIRRMEVFRKLMKQNENRFGEMAYNQRLWNRTVKDIAVASSLSAGWTLGFLDEFGAGPLRAARSLAGGKGLKAAARAGDLDQGLFVMAYVANAMMAGALITYAFTGQPPQNLMDYFLPIGPDGKRLNTPFYTREFVSLGKHIEEKGVASGVGQYFTNKATPVAGLAWEWLVTNQNYFGQELSDPNAPLLTRVGQKLASTYKDLEPISIRQIEQKGGGTPGEWALSFAGFGPAPSYATQTPTEYAIRSTYNEYHTSKTPYQKALYSNDRRALREAYNKGDMDKYQTLLEGMQQKYELTSQDVRRIEKGLEVEPTVKMFQGLTDDQQRRILDKMSAEERAKYLPRAHQNVRRSYTSPEER